MLILTEKSDVAKSFAFALNCEKNLGAYKNQSYTIVYCQGHLFDLYDAKQYDPSYASWSVFPIIPEKFLYCPKPLPQVKNVIEQLKKFKNDEILIATDADREGELIARECLNYAGITNLEKIRRFWVSEALTKDVVLDGIKDAKPLSEYNTLASQSFARQQSDWLVGINFSRYLTTHGKTKLIAGRVQTAILSAIQQRCENIQNFKPKQYFEFYGLFNPQRCGCKGLFFNDSGNSFFDTSLQKTLLALKGQRAVLKDNKKELKLSFPPLLYNLNDIQKDAFKIFNYTPEFTLSIIQKLYDELKCVSYPRTPSKVMGNSNVSLCKTIMNDLLSLPENSKYSELINHQNISIDNKRCFNDEKLESHHALIPLKQISNNAPQDEKNIYSLIFKRFIVAFLPAEKYESQKYILSVNNYSFTVTGKKILDKGWTNYKSLFSDNEIRNVADDNNDSDNQDLTNVDWDNLILSDIETKEKWSKPPKYFNEASILTFMENPKNETEEELEKKIKLIGIGATSTRHEYIPKLLKYGYIEKTEKNIVTTKLGIEFLTAVKNSSIRNVADIFETTRMEQELQDEPDIFLSNIRTFVNESVRKDINITISAVPTKSSIICPLCSSEVRKGKSNWFCVGYKQGCKFVIWDKISGANISQSDVESLCLGNKSSLKHCTSKTGKKFDCRFIYNKDENKIDFVFNKK